jgi:hypothetical protein
MYSWSRIETDNHPYYPLNCPRLHHPGHHQPGQDKVAIFQKIFLVKSKELLAPDIIPDQPDPDNDNHDIIDCIEDRDEQIGYPRPDNILHREVELECGDEDKE